MVLKLSLAFRKLKEEASSIEKAFFIKSKGKSELIKDCKRTFKLCLFESVIKWSLPVFTPLLLFIKISSILINELYKSDSLKNFFSKKKYSLSIFNSSKPVLLTLWVDKKVYLLSLSPNNSAKFSLAYSSILFPFFTQIKIAVPTLISNTFWSLPPSGVFS